MKTKQTTKIANKPENDATAIEREADVLFQKLYGKWYAFSTTDDDCFMTEVDETEVMKRMNKAA